MHGGCDAPPSMGTLLALAEAVLIVIAAQALGYMAKTFKFFPDAAEVGMGAFVGKVAFPALLFHAIATERSANVNLPPPCVIAFVRSAASIAADLVGIVSDAASIAAAPSIVGLDRMGFSEPGVPFIDFAERARARAAEIPPFFSSSCPRLATEPTSSETAAS